MNVRAHKPSQRARRRPGTTAGNSAIAQPKRDPDLARLATAEVAVRASAYQERVALAAYFIAEKRGFEPGHELDDWLVAEAQIAAAELPGVTTPIESVEAESMS
jgi:hypothetical protein